MKKLISFFGMLAVASSAFATNIELTVHHAPGGPSDTITRFIAKDLPDNYIVQNRPGAHGRIAMRQVLKGDSVITATMPQIYVTNPMNFKDLEYDPERDLEILATVAVMPNLLGCRSSLGFKTFADFTRYEGKPLSFAVAGYGSAEHIATELLLTKLKIKHIIVPYAAGGNKSIIDVLGGNVDCMFANFATIKPFVNDSRITTLLSSHELGQKTLTWEQQFKESFPYQSYICLVAAKSMNDATKKKIVSDLNKVFTDKNFKNSVVDLGLIPIGSTESWATNAVLKSNKLIGQFIVNNNLKVIQ